MPEDHDRYSDRDSETPLGRRRFVPLVGVEDYKSDPPSPERNFLIAILLRAVNDILLRPNADENICTHYKLQSNDYRSADAKRFIKSTNHQFQYICDLLDCDYDYMERSILKFIKRVIDDPTWYRNLKNAMQSM